MYIVANVHELNKYDLGEAGERKQSIQYSYNEIYNDRFYVFPNMLLSTVAVLSALFIVTRIIIK